MYVCNFVCGSDGGFYVIDLVVVFWLVNVGNLFIEDWFGCVWYDLYVLFLRVGNDDEL